MPANMLYDKGSNLRVVLTNPTTPVAGAGVVYGTMTGVALAAKDAAGYTSVDFDDAVWNLSVTENQSSSIAAGDPLFIDTAATTISNTATGLFFGLSMGVVTTGQTATIPVRHVCSPGSGTLGTGTVGATQLASSAVTLIKVSPNTMDGTIAKNQADADVIGGITQIFSYNLGNTAGDTDILVTHKIRVLDVWAVKLTATGGASDTVQLKNVTNAITDAMTMNSLAIKGVVRCAQIDQAYSTITAGTNMRATLTKTTDCSCKLYVLAARSA